MDIKRRFGGVARLYGETAFARFTQAHVCVVGVGGVGSWVVEALARSGIGQLTLIDLDHLAESNINRQLPALSSTLGKSKVVALAERVQAINPNACLVGIEDFLQLDNMADLIDGSMDWVLDCIDQFRVKAALIAHCRNLGIAVATAGGAGGKRDPSRIRISDLRCTEQDPLLARTRRQLRQRHGYSRDLKRNMGVLAVWSDEPLSRPQHAECKLESTLNCAGFGSCVTVTASMGFMLASVALQHLAQA